MNEGVLVKDLGSTNGTFVGSVRIREGVDHDRAEVLGGPDAHLDRARPASSASTSASAIASAIWSALRRRCAACSACSRRSRTPPLSILILGETGTGKEVVAKSVHDASDRKGGPFVVLDCGSIPASLAESILFGHEKGVFTGATERKKGALAEAHGGTLFLDELGELPLDLQPKLLRVLAERQVKRVGGNTFEPIDVRVLAATRRDLGVGDERRAASAATSSSASRRCASSCPRCASASTICRSSSRRSASASASREAAPIVEDWIEQRLGSLRLAGQRARARERGAGRRDARRHARRDRRRAHARARLRRRRAARGGARRRRSPRPSAARSPRSSASTSRSSRARAKGNVSEMARQSGMERHHVRAYLRKYGIEKGLIRLISRFRRHSFRERDAALRVPADGRAHDRAAPGRCAGGLDPLLALLPGARARRLLLRARGRVAARGAHAGRCSSSRSSRRRSSSLPIVVDEQLVESLTDEEPLARAPRRAAPLGGAAVLRPVDDVAAAPALVRGARRDRPVSPVCCKQCREHGRAARLSVRGRAVPRARRSRAASCTWRSRATRSSS